jgi:RNA-binding protein 8A
MSRWFSLILGDGVSLTFQGYALIEYATLEEAKAAITGTNGKKILDQEIRADFAFVRGPSKHERGRRFDSGGRGGDRRGRSRSPRSQSPVGRDPSGSQSLESRIEA